MYVEIRAIKNKKLMFFVKNVLTCIKSGVIVHLTINIKMLMFTDAREEVYKLQTKRERIVL